MYSKILLQAVSVLLISCNANSSTDNDTGRIQKQQLIKQNDNPYSTIEAIPLPGGFTRTACDSNSFTAWLRKTALKKSKTV